MSEARYNAARNQYEIVPSPTDDMIYTADGPIAKVSGIHAIAKTSAAAMTLADPVAAEEGIRLLIICRTGPFAHSVSVPGGLGGNSTTAKLITFSKIGDSIELVADNLKWVQIQQGIALT